MVSQMTKNWTTLYYQTYNPCVILNEMLLLASNLSISRIGYNLSTTFISNTYPFLLRFREHDSLYLLRTINDFNIMVTILIKLYQIYYSEGSFAPNPNLVVVSFDPAAIRQIISTLYVINDLDTLAINSPRSS
jgi:hypothetical protein